MRDGEGSPDQDWDTNKVGYLLSEKILQWSRIVSIGVHTTIRPAMFNDRTGQRFLRFMEQEANNGIPQLFRSIKWNLHCFILDDYSTQQVI